MSKWGTRGISFRGLNLADPPARQLKQWFVNSSGGVAHVIPIGDSMEHSEAPARPCCPTVDDDGRTRIYVHHADDGREAGEPDMYPRYQRMRS